MTTSWMRPDTEAAYGGPAASYESLALSTTGADPERAEVVAQLKSEMRAPMVALQALRTTLDQGGLSPEVDGKMRRHTKSLARRLALLLEDLALIHTWGQRRLALDLQDLDLADQMNRAADLFPDLLIYVEAPSDARVRADSMRLQQLLANLIHSGQRGGGPGCLYVTCLDSMISLRMIGAPPVGGYELDIVRQLVDAHGGKLRHHPAEGSVTVTLQRALSPQPSLT